MTMLAPKYKGDESVREEKKNKFQVPAGDDDGGRGMFDVWKSLSPPLNINKQLTSVASTDKREINCGDRDIWTYGGRKRGKMITTGSAGGKDGKVCTGINGEKEKKRKRS